MTGEFEFSRYGSCLVGKATSEAKQDSYSPRKKMKKRYALSLSLVLMSLAGVSACDRAPESEKSSGEEAAVERVWRPVDAGELTPHQRAMVDYAGQSRGIMGQRLMGTVMEAARTDGFDGAIEVCKQEAGPIAAEIEESRKVRIGRTSDRLRNPENEPPGWFRDRVGDESGEQFVALANDGTVGAAIPIFLAAPCMNCHGATEVLAEGVSSALERLYPEDQAIGYGKGDLRGWFWVEVPPETVPVPPVRERGESEEAVELEHGEKLYVEFCAACHGRDGAGVPNAFPTLMGTERVLGPAEPLIALSLDGVAGPLKVGENTYNGFMPGQAQLSNQDLAALLSFVRTAWGNDASEVSAEEVEAVRAATALRTRAWTDEELRELAAREVKEGVD